MKYEIAIIGAGPCGLFTALEVMGKNKVVLFDIGRPLEKKTCPLEKIGKCVNCKPVCSILGGFGGAQFFEGTKLSRSPAGSGLLKFSKKDDLEVLYDYVDQILEKYGKAPRDYPKKESIQKLKDDFESVGVGMKYYNAQKVSKGTMNRIALNIHKVLLDNGVDVQLNTMVNDVNKNGEYFEIEINGEIIQAKKVVLAVGRIGSRWLIRLAEKVGIQYEEDHLVELGIRVEMPFEIFNPINNIHNDLKLKRITGKGDELRTFCQDYKGYITKCVYNLPGDDIVSSLDGHIIGTDEEGGTLSDVTNIGIHHRFNCEEGIDYIYKLIKKMNHNGKPMVQSMKNFLLDKKTENKIRVKLSMPDAVFENINDYLPESTLLKLKDFIYRMDRIMPGFAHDENAVYTPSFEMGWKKMKVDKNFETDVKGIFIGGDINGHFRGALQAMISGVLIGRYLNEEMA
jgi:uncharacterized protein